MAAIAFWICMLVSFILRVACFGGRLIRSEGVLNKDSASVPMFSASDPGIVVFGSNSTIPQITELGDLNMYLDTLAANLTGHVDMRRSCGPGPECYSCGGPAKVKHAARLVHYAIQEGIVGDFVEAGVWRGGISIMARMAQRVWERAGDSGRRTYVCDSFQGLPHNSTSEDVDVWADIKWMKMGIEAVRDNFAKFHALDDHVYFVKGFFQSSMPILRQHFQSTGRKIAVLRGDGDMFESYYDMLYNLYEFIPVGGYFVCDDCSSIGNAAKAVEMFRRDHNITDPYQFLDVCTETYRDYIGDFWWKKGKDVKVDYNAYLRWNSTRHKAPVLLQETVHQKWECDRPPRGPMRFW